MLVAYRQALQQLVPDLEFVTTSKISGSTPKWWLEALAEAKAEIRVARVLAVWELVAGDRLPLTITALTEHCVDVAAVNIGGQFFLLYGIASADGLAFYLGGNSQQVGSRSPGGFRWETLPDGLADFYCSIHDGFFEFGKYRMGPLPLDTMRPMGAGIVVFQSGDDGYIAVTPDFARFDSGQSRNQSVLLLPGDLPSVEDFWPLLDQWIQLGLTPVRP